MRFVDWIELMLSMMSTEKYSMAAKGRWKQDVLLGSDVAGWMGARLRFDVRSDFTI